MTDTVLNKNHFELFGFPVDFNIDLPKLNHCYKTIQQKVHPDRFAGESEYQQRLAVQWASAVNDAYQILKDPLSRAVYMCTLLSGNAQLLENVKVPGEFLFEQMELRDKLESLSTEAQAEAFEMALVERIRYQETKLQALFERSISSSNDSVELMESAAQTVQEFRYLRKLLEEIQGKLKELR